MKVNKENNDRLKEALKDRNEVTNNLLSNLMSNQDLDDKDIETVHKYMKLTQFLKDLIYLTSNYSVAEIADMYQISTTHIYNTIKKIRKLIK